MAQQQQVRELVATAVDQGDAVVDLETMSAAALDADSVTCVDLAADGSPFPACSDLASFVPALRAVAAAAAAALATEAASG